MALLVVRGDAVTQALRRRGRFAIDVGCLHSEAHVEAAAARAVDRFIAGMAREGFRYDAGLQRANPIEEIKAAVRNFLRRSADGIRRYDDVQEDTTAQVLPHITVSQDYTPDPGQVPVPPPPIGATGEQVMNYRAVCDRLSAIERARVARDVPAMRDLVDVRVRLAFRERVGGQLLTVPSSVRGAA